ncbi:MAG: META domain-containing protein [Acidobacteria bacterium]|nr:META domain-containing protein [Acidobacteriota bacterium]
MKLSRFVRVAVFAAAGTAAACHSASPLEGPSPLPAISGLNGTSWQLVRFIGGDDTVLLPRAGAAYTVEFGSGGELSARVDCNRGRGSWQSSGPNQLQFGPLALTRALCPDQTLHDQIIRQWDFVRSYVLKDRRLFLSLMADGGVYEFEPMGSNAAK